MLICLCLYMFRSCREEVEEDTENKKDEQRLRGDSDHDHKKTISKLSKLRSTSAWISRKSASNNACFCGVSFNGQGWPRRGPKGATQMQIDQHAKVNLHESVVFVYLYIRIFVYSSRQEL
jgi:hypothetical protein